MKRRGLSFLSVLFISLVFLPLLVSAQGTRADYERAAKLREKVQNLALEVVDRSGWIEKTPPILVSPDRQGRRRIRRHGRGRPWPRNRPSIIRRLAAALSAASGEKYYRAEPAVPGHRLHGQRDRPGVRRRRFQVAMRRSRITPSRRSGPRRAAVPAPGRRRSRPRRLRPRIPRLSPDGKWEAFVKNYNVWLRPRIKKTSSP